MLDFPLPSDRAARLVVAYLRTLAVTTRDNRPVHKAADSRYKPFLVAVQYAFNKGRKAVKGKSVKTAPDAGATAVRKALLDVLPSELLKAVGAGGTAGAAELTKTLRHASFRTAADPLVKKIGPITMRFDIKSPEAIKWAKEHAADLAKGISSTTRDDIAAAIERSLESGDDPFEDIADAVGSDARAQLIARTETMAAANEGQRQSWDQAVEDGLLPSDAQVGWIATSGCCDECDDLDGETRDLDGEYPDPGGDGPPLHPNCRCTEGIVA